MVSEYQAAFVEALRGSRAMQKRVFDTIEERHAKDFRNGRVGQRLYEHLLSAVRESGMPAIEAEFENRFLPLLKAKQPHGEAEAGSPKQELATRLIWISTACVAAVTLGAVVVGVGALKTTFAGSPLSIKTPVVENDATQPSPPAITDPAPQTAIDASNPAPKDTETTNEAASESASTNAVEQEPAAR